MSDFLSKLCRDTFAGYAISQIKKARGLNKKILNPLHKERKSLLNFCYVLASQGTSSSGSQPLLDWLAAQGRTQEHCGLVSVPHARDVYALFYDESSSLGFQGVIVTDESNEVSLSSIPKELALVTYLYVNHDGYSSYCKDYREYWEWVEKRNDVRYQNALDHGKNYDAKNMMHMFRLLDMATEILESSQILVRRPNRAELLQIRSGAFNYDDLIKQAQHKVVQIDTVATRSPLPDRPDLERINQSLVELRTALYNQ